MARPRFAPRLALAGGMLATAIGAAVGLVVVLAPLLGGLEQVTLASRFHLRDSRRPTGVVVVGIDDRSFAALHHRWPFPRSWHGQVLRQLHRAGARAVFYDVQFTEPTAPAQDNALYHALGTTGGAVLATTETDGHGHTNVLGGDANLARVHSRAAASAFPVDFGGVIDRVPYTLDGLQTPAVILATRLQGHPPAQSEFAGRGAYIDYRGGPGTIRTISFSDVLLGRFSPSVVRGRVVVVGATSPSLQDLHATPVASDALMSGPEIQANAIWTVLNEVPLRPIPAVFTIALIVLIAGVGPAAWYWRRSPLAVAVAAPLGAALYLAGAQAAFDIGWVIPVVGPLLGLTVSGLAVVVISHLLVTSELRATQLEIVQRLGRAAESRDGATGRHLDRMAFLCEELALAAGLSRRAAALLRQASALHDVGKIAMPDRVLLKRGDFDPHERAIMSAHASIGAGMLAGSSTSLIQLAEVVARTHHERWDGSGYPVGLAGERIPLAGRICAICDVFDALINPRSYKAAWSLEASLDEIERGAGSAFDPRLTAIFIRIAPRLYRELADQLDPAAADPPDRREQSGDGVAVPARTVAPV